MFIWELEIEKIERNTVFFTNGTKRKCTKKEIEVLSTEEATDLTTQRDLLLNAIIPDILKLLMDYNIKKWDIQAVIQGVVWTYNENFNIAVWKAFWTYEEGVHTAYFTENIRMTDIKKFI